MSDLLHWLPPVVAILLLLGWYLSYSATRLDRLHHRVEASRAALDEALARRAAVATAVADRMPEPAGRHLAEVASATLAAEAGAGAGLGALDRPLPEGAENDLTRALGEAFDDPAGVDRLRREAATSALLDELAIACGRVQLARRFHNDAVAHAQRVRRKRTIRWFRLAGLAAMPQMIEIDDSSPAALPA